MKIKCQCGARYRVNQSLIGDSARCVRCRAILHLVVGALPFAPGGGDFQARLVIESGPGMTGEQYFLGGAAPINIGKSSTKPVHLPGQRVSRDHGRLLLTDPAGPVWQYEDLGSTNGSFVDGVKVKFHDLQPGDSLRIGEYHLRYFCERKPAQE